MTRLRIVFMGTPALAATILEALLREEQFEVVAAVTQPDQPKGRDLQLHPSEVKRLALSRGVPLLQPQRARDPEFTAQMRVLAPDLVVVAAFGQILPQALLDVPKFGCLNVHTSLLPKYRGAAPIQWAVLNGDAGTGVTIMKMDAGLDTGDVVSQEQTAITDDDTAETLHARLAEMGARLLVRTIPPFVQGTLVPQPQPSGSTYARKIRKEDGRIDWSQPARAVWNRIRGLTPWPGTFTFLLRSPAPVLIKVLAATPIDSTRATPGEILCADKDALIVACGEGALLIRELQREGGKRLPTRQFLAGFHMAPGERVG
jgi:methionyl-tRNA formyltransferase